MGKSKDKNKISVKEKEENRFWKKVKTIFPLSFVIAFVLDLVYGFFYYRQYNASSLFDTSSYWSALDNILAGKPDLLRTPVYPLFLHLCDKINHEYVNEVSVGIQIGVFCISIWFFYMLLSRFTDNSVLKCTGTVLYGCMTPVINYNFLMLTESFSISGLVILAYFLVLFIDKRSFGCYAGCIYGSLLLTMIRPSAIYLFIVIAMAALPPVIDVIRKKAKVNVAGLVVSLVSFALCGGFLLGYMAKNKACNNYYGLSYVSEMNRFYDVAQADIWRDNPDTEILAYMNDQVNEGSSLLSTGINTEAYFRDLDTDHSRITEFNRSSIESHPKEYAYYLAKKVIVMGYTHSEYNLSNDSFFFKEDADKTILWIGDLLDFNINFVYFVVLITGIGIIAVAVKKKQLLWSMLMLFLIIGGQLGVNVLAGPAEFHRLNAPCYPFALLLVIIWAGLAFDRLTESSPARGPENEPGKDLSAETDQTKYMRPS